VRHVEAASDKLSSEDDESATVTSDGDSHEQIEEEPQPIRFSRDVKHVEAGSRRSWRAQRSKCAIRNEGGSSSNEVKRQDSLEQVCALRPATKRQDS
jgi:hypothetical protein